MQASDTKNVLSNITPEDIIRLMQSRPWTIQRFNGAPLYLHNAATESGWMIGQNIFSGYTHFVFLFQEGQAAMYYDEEDFDRLCGAFYAHVQKESDLDALENGYHARYTAAIEQVAHRTLANESDADLIANLHRAFACITDAVHVAHIIESVTFGSEKIVRAAMARGTTFVETDFGTLCSPIRPSFLSVAHEKLWTIKHAPEKTLLINEYIRDFGYTQTTYCGSTPLIPSNVREQADHLTEPPTAIDTEKLSAQKQRIIQKYRLGKKERFIVRMIERCFSWQDDRKKRILQSITCAEPILADVARRFDIPLTTLTYAFPDEITPECLSDPSFHATLRDRQKGCVIYTAPHGHAVFTGTDAATVIRALHAERNDAVTEIRGTVASKGYAKGTVRVCESVSDIGRFQTGDILVASMTRPEYMPAMHKAIAFVTDEGGITCHAAIVSREMGKPCIIGTKIATQVLKDGDVVEVDAQTGVVRKIS